jgi:hypothetical protein
MTAPFQLNTPSKPQTVGASTGRNQKDRRYMDTFFDLHRSARFQRGRPWCGPREIAANTDLMPEDGFCIPDLMQGEYVEDEMGNCDRASTLMSTWTAPWTPVAKYFKFNYPRKLISFDYARMRMDEEKSLDEYYQAAALLGAQLNVRVDYGVIPSFQITAKLGHPTKFLKIAEAAIAGDPWLLGHIDEPNPDLAAILGFNARGMRVTSYAPPVPEPVVTPAQVIATPPADLMKMIAEMTAQAVAAAMDAREARASVKKGGNGSKGGSAAQLAAARAAKTAKAVDITENPAERLAS